MIAESRSLYLNVWLEALFHHSDAEWRQRLRTNVSPAAIHAMLLPRALEAAYDQPSPRGRRIIEVCARHSDHTRTTHVSSHTHQMHGQGPAEPQPLPGVNSIIAVGSGKGGVGKTTLAVNLAIALARMGNKVGLLDADVYGPNVPLMLGSSEQPSVVGEDRLLPPERYGLKVISVGFLSPGDKPLVWRGPMLHSIIRQFLGQVEWGELDYLVVDLPPGTGDVVISLVQTVPLTGAVIVTTPSDVSLQDARKAIEMFKQVKVDILGIV